MMESFVASPTNYRPVGRFEIFGHGSFSCDGRWKQGRGTNGRVHTQKLVVVMPTVALSTIVLDHACIRMKKATEGVQFH